MFSTTLHPASQNFHVKMSDECANTGRICASVVWSGSQGMSMLHMWVDWTTLPLGRVILRGLVDGCLFTTGEPSTMKWPVAPESEMAYFIALHTSGLLKMVAAIGSSCKLFACTRVSHIIAT